MEEFLTHYYDSSYFIAATVICFATLIFHSIEISYKKPQNRIFALIILFTMISS